MAIKFLTYLLISLLMLSFFNACKNGRSTYEEESAQNVYVADVEIKDLSAYRVAAAPVTAYRRVYVNSSINGEVITLNYEEGDMVDKDELLINIDVRKQESQLRNALATYNEAKQRFDRIQYLYNNDAVSAEELEKAKMGYEQNSAELEFWQTEVSYGEIRAPINGVITDKLVEMGTTVSQNERVYTIENHDLLVLRPGLSEKDVVGLQKGDSLLLSFDVYDQVELNGVIRRIYPSADRVTRLFTVEVEILQNDDFPVRPGYLGRVNFITDHRSDVVALPSESVQHNGEKTTVFVVNQEKLIEKRDVKIGVERDGWIEIVEGLSAGEQVVAGGLDMLEDDQKVNVTGKFRRYGFRE
ncbi:efflux RND transporter periplasmic adaptor subunit [Marinilabiliaceae bacterium ANBcel2]|nr:efflux RND transporter periplasmic adaptor subunit [Marinilabiliaceae bacterium ANBcel2]